MELWLTPLGVENNAALNVGVQIPFQDPAFRSFGFIPRSLIAGSCGHFMFNVLKKGHPVFSSDCPILPP